MMFEKSPTVSNSASHDISHNVLNIQGTCPHSLSMGYKNEFEFAQLLDVDSSNGRAVCSTTSQLNLEFFLLGFFA